jgi:hypothetical protein
MSVILDTDCCDLLIDPGMKDAATATEMLTPFGARGMKLYPVSPRVNVAKNDDLECAAANRLE